MLEIHKKIVLGEDQKPFAVLISYRGIRAIGRGHRELWIVKAHG